MSFLQELKFYLTEPAYLRKLCEWGMVWLAYLGMLALLISVGYLKDRKAMYCSLVLLTLAALLVVPAERCERKTASAPTARVAASQRLRDTRQHNVWMFYTQAGLCIATMLAVRNLERGGTGWLTTVFLGAGTTGTVALWANLREMQILGDGLPMP